MLKNGLLGSNVLPAYFRESQSLPAYLTRFPFIAVLTRARGASHYAQDDRLFLRAKSVLDREILKSVAEQMMTSGEVSVEGKALRVTRTGSRRLRTVRFLMGDTEYQ